MTKDKPDNPADKVKDMAIETVSADILARQGFLGQGAKNPLGNKADEWLAALERASFTVTDDRIDAPASPEPGAPQQGGVPMPGVPPIPPAPPELAVQGSGMAQLPARGHSPMTPSASTGLPVNPATVTYRAPGAATLPLPGVRVSQNLLAQSFTKLTGNAPGASQRYRALLNQATFIDVNLQLTHSSEGPVLWIRDFKAKYSQELHHWTQELQTVLEEQGQKLSRIMLNGRPINQISDILGG